MEKRCNGLDRRRKLHILKIPRLKGGAVNLYSLLKPERINLDLTSRKKQDVLLELVSSFREDEDSGLLVSTLLKREDLGSTGIGKGVAIPHGRSLVVDKLELVVGRSTKGISFDAIDKKPVHLFFLIVAPPQDPGNQYLITLGRVAVVCQELLKRKQYEKPQTPEEFIQLVKEIEGNL
ncbi:PTS sugar transporter subunit IIA [candidate division WOR-3 bacterium]|uniref:PTS sugar transporter subunit IIA n=1 Tax=candidate division WOR-3 bacterium TaxID=2052148 RepID=A0A9D5KAW7_UNCW3|nr:PTS sugar transporter subunit IIA [candidate division WOR-3 bacterium]MBD3365626.1 PTS sugar transporter subunit IIA [candidate division WOR-3 bacterium]